MWRWVRASVALALLVVAGAWAIRRAAWTRSVYNVRHALFECRFDDALAELKSLNRRRPDDPEIFYLLAAANRRAGHTAQARDYLAKAKRAEWSLDEIHHQEVMIDFQAGKIAESEPYLLGLVHGNCPDALAVEVYECLVKGYLADMRLPEAMNCLDYWTQWQPQAFEPRVLRAEVFEATRDRARQAAEYEAMLAIDPDRVETRLKLGHLLLDQHNAEAALTHFQHCQKLTPDALAVKVALGACCHHLGKLDEARNLLSDVLKNADSLTGPQRAYALLEAGQIALERRDFPDAENSLRESLSFEPTNSTANYALGIVLTRLGQDEVGKKYLDRSESLGRSFSRYAELMREITQEPHRARPRAEAAEVLLEAGDRKLAWSWLMSALRCDRNDVFTHKMFAKYHAEAGNDEMVKRHVAWAEEFSEGPRKEAAR